jgi:hypothetical protein
MKIKPRVGGGVVVVTREVFKTRVQRLTWCVDSVAFHRDGTVELVYLGLATPRNTRVIYHLDEIVAVLGPSPSWVCAAVQRKEKRHEQGKG